MVNLRKVRRLQVFRSHRLRHFFSSDDRIRQKFYTICQHLDLVGGDYSDEQKLTVLLFIMVGSGGGGGGGGDMPQIADFIRYELANELVHHRNHALNTLISNICHIVDKIHNHHYQTESRTGIAARFEDDTQIFRLNVISICDLMIELLSLLLQSFGHQCETSEMGITITTDILHMFELCYQWMDIGCATIERNLKALLALTTHGAGRLGRTKVIIEYKPLMQHLLHRMPGNVGNRRELLLTLQILNNLASGFPENIEHLLRLNLLRHLRNHLVGENVQSTHAIIEQCLCILDNICGNHRSDIQAVLDTDLIAPIINGNGNSNKKKSIFI